MPILPTHRHEETRRTSSDRWSTPPHPLTLGSDQVHVWCASLDLDKSRLHSLQQTLSADERSRAERFHFLQDRRRFIVARGLLRAILGRYLDVEPSHLRFCYNPHGKPALAREFGGAALCFNLSHSHELALYAIARGRELGIDLEHLRMDVEVEEIAAQFFSAYELATLRALPTNKQREAFFACWTRKEAYIKAKGEGLTIGLNQFDVALAPGEPAALLRVNGDAEEASRWSLQELFPGPGYAAAVAVEGHDLRPTDLFHYPACYQ